MDKHLPKVTIITTTFNLSSDSREDFFEKCCESVHNQTYKNIEHIVQDGASSDGTIELIEKYQNLGWLKLYSEPDKGIDDGYNKGISHATGKYVFFLNSDDQYYSDDVIEKCVEILEKENADYSYATTYLLNEKNPKRSTMRVPKIWKSFSKMPFCHQSMFCKVDVLKEIGLFDVNNKITSDYEVYLRLLFGGYKAVEVDEHIVTFRIGGISDNMEGFKKERCELFKKIYSPFYELSDVQIGEIYENSYFPIGLAFKIAKYLRFSDRIRFLYEEIRRFIFQVRTSKKHRLVRVFGHRFV